MVVILLLVNSGYTEHKYNYTINQNSGTSKNFQSFVLNYVKTKQFRVKKTNDINSEIISKLFFFLWLCGPTRAMASSFLRFLDHTQRRTTAGRTPLDEWSARRRDLYLITHNTHNRQTSMPPVGFEPTISAGERPQNYALDRAATGTGLYPHYYDKTYWNTK